MFCYPTESEARKLREDASSRLLPLPDKSILATAHCRSLIELVATCISHCSLHPFCCVGAAGCVSPQTRMTAPPSGCGRAGAAAPPSGCTKPACNAGWTRSSEATARRAWPVPSATPSTLSSSPSWVCVVLVLSFTLQIQSTNDIT